MRAPARPSEEEAKALARKRAAQRAADERDARRILRLQAQQSNAVVNETHPPPCSRSRGAGNATELSDTERRAAMVRKSADDRTLRHQQLTEKVATIFSPSLVTAAASRLSLLPALPTADSFSMLSAQQ